MRSTRSARHQRRAPGVTEGSVHDESPVVRRSTLTVGRADDRAERDADAVAAAVMRTIDRLGPPATATEVASEVAEAGGELRRAAAGRDRLGGTTVDEDLAHDIESTRGRGGSIPATDRSVMERSFGRGLGGVTTHTDGSADRIARRLEATAFTVGSDIYFQSGAYQPGTRSGRSLLAHELAHVDQQPGSAVHRRTVIRRRFGLEIELQKVFTGGVAAAAEQLGDVAPGETFVTEPKYQGKQPITSKETGFDVHADHSDAMGQRMPVYNKKTGAWVATKNNKGPIVELVTHPFDEFTQSDTDIAKVMTDMADLARSMASTGASQSYADLGLSGPKDNFVGASPAGVKKGLMGQALPAPKAGGQIQVTFGVRLDRIKELLELQGGKKDTPAVVAPTTAPSGLGGAPPPPPPPGAPPPVVGTTSKSGEANLRGAEIADEIATELYGRYHDKKTYQVEDKDHPGTTKTKKRTFANSFKVSNQGELEDLTALLAMLANYLVAGRSDLGFGWGKNKVGGLFYKSKLSDIRNAVTGEAHTLIKERQAKIRDMVLAKTGRTADESVLLGRDGGNTGGVTCGAWLDAVLSGKDDPLFGELKNEYASDIKPELVGPTGDQHMAAVIENRKIGELLSTMVPVTNGALIAGRPPADWSPIATGIAGLLRVLNGTNVPSRNDLDTAVGR